MYEVAPGTTNFSVFVFLRDSLTGQAKPGLTWNSAGAEWAYARQGGTGVPITLTSLSSATAPWQSGGFIAVNSAEGLYRLDVPNAANAAGASFYAITGKFDGALAESVLVLLRAPATVVGPGGFTFDIFLKTTSNTPIVGAGVWISTDEQGQSVVAGVLSTGTTGKVTFNLSAGTYYAWFQAPGYTVANPYTFSVNAAGSITFTLANTPPPPIFQLPSSRPPSFTAHDLQERLIDFVGGDPDVSVMRSVRRAIHDSIREFATASRWNYLRDIARINLKGVYRTGTVSYNTSTKVATITGGTWPLWAADGGYLKINESISRVGSRLSPTQLLMDIPLFDQTYTNEKYSLIKPSYVLPLDFVAAENAMVETRWGRLRYVAFDELLNMVRHLTSESTPMFWSLASRRDGNPGLSIWVYPVPDQDSIADIMYYRSPRRIKYFDVQDGLATITTATPTSVSFTDPILVDDMVGSILRLSANKTTDPGGPESVTPFAHEATIKTVVSPTQATIDVAVTQNFQQVRYRISDPVDVEEILLPCLGRCGEKNYAISRVLQTMPLSIQAYSESLVRAKEADSRVTADRAAFNPYEVPTKLRVKKIDFTVDS